VSLAFNKMARDRQRALKINEVASEFIDEGFFGVSVSPHGNTPKNNPISALTKSKKKKLFKRASRASAKSIRETRDKLKMLQASIVEMSREDNLEGLMNLAETLPDSMPVTTATTPEQSITNARLTEWYEQLKTALVRTVDSLTKKSSK